jgi:DNA-binding MarR family transcriptional regulator
MSAGLFMLSRLTPSSSNVTASLLMLVLGVGLGMVMQVLVIAVQNAVDYGDLGVATSGATLFRLIGGSLGTAILGAIFSSRLSANLGQLLPGGGIDASHMNVQTLQHLPPAAHAAYAQAFTQSLGTVFLVATIVCAIGFALTWFMPEKPLRATVAATARDAGSEAGEAFARPSDDDAVAAQLYATLSSLADRDVQRQHLQLIVDRAGETLSPLAAFLLVQLEREPNRSLNDVARSRNIPPERITTAIDELNRRGLITASATTAPANSKLTREGCEVLDRIVDARREHLSELAEEWNKTGGADAATFLRETVAELVPVARRPA